MNLNRKKLSFQAMALSSALLLTQATFAESAEIGDYKIDPAHTSVLFVVSHLGTSELAGRFNTVEGSLQLAADNAKVQVSIDTASVDTNHQKRDDHLRGPDFFNAKQYPNISFVSTNVVMNSAGEPEMIEGQFTLHGETKAIKFNTTAVGAGKDPWGGYRAGYNATTTINRSDYGMDFMLGGVGDTISITLHLEAIKQ